MRMDEVAALPMAAGCVVPSARRGTTAAPDALPARRPLPGSSPVIGRAAPARLRSSPGRGGPLQFPPPPSDRSTPSTPGGSSGLLIQALHPFRGLRPEGRGSAPPLPPDGGYVHGAAGFAWMLRTGQLLPPTGLLTLRFGAGRFPPAPAACYRAPWRLPGPDSHRLATTSLRWIRSRHGTTSTSWTHSRSP